MARKAKKINISQVAKQAKVSIASVSRAINNHPDVSEKLRQQVLAVIADTDFSSERSTEKKLRINVVIGVGDITDYIATVLTGIGLAADEEGVEISIQRCIGKEPLLRMCRIWRSDAVILISGGQLVDEVPSLAKAGIPCMLVNQPVTEYDNVGYIHNDSYTAQKLMLEYLKMQNHRQIAFLAAAPMTIPSYAERIRAYQEFMEAIGEDPERLLIKPHPISHIDGLGRDKEAGYQEAMQLLAREPEVTALVCANDEIAFGAFRACLDWGLRIPEDISIVGCDDQSFARFLSPRLTTIRLPMTETGNALSTI